jgi:cobalt/nickel transport system permease protein
MLGVHALIGIGEALITVAAVSFVQRTRPDLLEAGTSQARGGRGWIYAGLLVSLVVVLLSPFASADPDGLERVAEDLGFFNQTVDSPFQLLSSYTIPFMGDSAYSTILAGLIGVLVVAGVTYGVTKLMQRPAGH